MRNDRLFRDDDVFNVLGLEMLLSEVGDLTEEDLFSDSKITELKEDLIKKAKLEISVESDRKKNKNKQVRVDGKDIQIDIFYKGNKRFFNLKPSKPGLNPPCVDHITDNTLVIYITNDEVEFYKNTLDNICKYIEWINNDIPNIKEKFIRAIDEKVNSKRLKINSTKDTIDKLME